MFGGKTTRRSFFVVLLLPVITPSAYGQNSFADGGRNIGHGFKEMALATGHAFKEGGKAVGRGFKKAGIETGRAFKQMGKDIGRLFQGKLQRLAKRFIYRILAFEAGNRFG